MTDRVTQLVTGLGVPGYRRSDVIVLGNVALVGLDLTGPAGPAGPGAQPPGNIPGPGGPAAPPTGPGTPGGLDPGAATPGAPNTPAGPGPAAGGLGGVPGFTGDPARMVADRIVAARVGVTQALVTTDADLVARIGSLANDIRSGRPVTDRIDEIQAVVKQINGGRGSLPNAFPTNPGAR